jgi:hypothetical protein
MATLPNVDQAIVADEKLTDYLMNHTHPRGGPKARFLERFGFSVDRPHELRAAFLAHANQNDISASRDNDFGTIFEIEGELPSPDGRNPQVRTVWMLDTGATAPRLITMVPAVAQPTSRSAT